MFSESRILELYNKNTICFDDIPIIETKHTVYRSGNTQGSRQSLPFTKILLPHAFTGFLKPLKRIDHTHKAIQIILPGTGTTFSIAETLCDVAGTFHGRKSKNR